MTSKKRSRAAEARKRGESKEAHAEEAGEKEGRRMMMWDGMEDKTAE